MTKKKSFVLTYLITQRLVNISVVGNSTTLIKTLINKIS